MLQKPIKCVGCPLYGNGRGFSELEGKCSNGVMILSDFLDDSAAVEGLPLRSYSQAGSVFQRSINNLGLSRNDFGITSIVRCKPHGGVLDGAGYELESIARCHHFLVQAISYFKPKVILALGNVPLRALTGLSGKKKTVSSLRGYVQWNKEFNLPVVPTYHPAFLARGKKNLIGLFMRDMTKALRIAKGELVEGRDYYLNPQETYPNEYNLRPDSAHWHNAYHELLENPALPIAYDIETKESLLEDSEEDITATETVVTQWQISLRKGHAIVCERGDEADNMFFGRMSNFMSLPNPKLSWNGWNFDEPVLAKYGVRLSGDSLDLMTAFRHYQPDIPSGLQNAASLFNFPFAWKHLSGEDLPFYGACDVDALHWIYEPLKGLMVKENLW